MNEADSVIMANRGHVPHSVCRVAKPSMKPAVTKTGTVPTIIFRPRRAACMNDVSRP